ncbi:MAG: aminotransferase class IV [Lachnospiraceae bacterium]|nr:aminotransferase class IV [Lachnospiraceae bacterium]
MKITLDEGYQFGLGVFETVSVEQGEPLLLDWHLERLHASLEELGIKQTVTETEVRAFLSSQDGAHHALKIMVSGENKVFTMRRNPYTEESARKGFALVYSGVYRNETSPLVRHKTLNYGDCILEKRRAAGLGADEQIFLNSRGELCEGTVSNIFFAREGRLYTPPVSCGLLPGILRRFILEHFPVEERVLKKEDVLQMEECFVTNSLMGVMPVVSLEKKSFVPGRMTERCAERYRSILP